MKRLALLSFVLLAGCPLTNTSGGDCQIDSDCGSSDVCARDSMCTASNNVREVIATWTINGAAPTPVSCTRDDLFISFIGNDSGDTLGYSPVPCRSGQFTVDKLPIRFRQVELGVEGGPRDIKPINGSGNAALDLHL